MRSIHNRNTLYLQLVSVQGDQKYNIINVILQSNESSKLYR